LASGASDSSDAAGTQPSAAGAGIVAVSTTLDLSELDPGFNTSTRIAS